jgi:chromate reductase
MHRSEPFRILALVGSYRSGSHNQALLAAAREEAPPHVEFDEVDLRTVPYYDGDLEAAGDPEPVQALKQAVRAADALLVITPEYNGGVPGVLKNGIDWTSRRYPDAPIRDKLVAVIGATPGRGGTASAQEHLRQVLGRTGATIVEDAELRLARAGDAISDGTVTDPEVREQVAAVVHAILATSTLCAETGSNAA